MTEQGRPALRESLRDALPAWLASRVIVLVGLEAARLLSSHGGSSAGRLQSSAGLMAWDAGWYQSIAVHGYGGVAEEALRFFPLWPGIAQAGTHVGIPATWSLGLGANLAFLAALVAFDQLGTAIGFARSQRRLSVWLISLAPGAVATVLGYAEGLLVLLVSLALALLYAQRGREGSLRWLVIALLGALAGATRPVGILLVVPVAIEAWKQRSRRELIPVQVLAVASPMLGTAAYLAWVGAAFGDAMLPVRIQTEAGRHGALGDPISGIVHAASLAAGGHLSAFVHLCWVAVAVAAIWLGRRSVPASATALSVVVVAVALCGSNLDSFERYLLAAPPIFLSGAAVLRTRNTALIACGGLGLLLLAMSLLTFTGRAVP